MPDDELLRRLDEIEGRLDRIQADVNVVAYINKHDKQALLLERFWGVIKNSPPMQQMWSVMNDFVTQEEIAQKANVQRGNIGSYLRRMHDEGMVHKRSSGRRVEYRRAYMTEGIGLEKAIRDALKDRTKKVGDGTATKASDGNKDTGDK